MSVSKRTRFEVLRRDNFTCQYCGAKAPDVTLHVDHVEPVALGGSDKPDNLLAACKDCNMGKTSIVPGSPLVEAVGAKAAAYALGMVDKMTRFRADIDSLEEYVDSFKGEWETWHATGSSELVPLPVDYEMTLFKWKQMGIPLEVYRLAIPSAMKRDAVRRDDKFTYMCGIVWNLINQREIDYSVTEETCAVFTEYEASERAIDGYEHGQKSMLSHVAYWRDTWPIEHDILMHHIDGTTNEFIDSLRAVA